ncbi:uncharacterized protein N7496_004977 [Penicillium cataractarum]|uniref:ZZ-type domain-containing protein n=1 Tax=Penicillium cataractarum TaxID=2100454 RepID=A0A9W9SFB8_9EURO|nr:uncharacterized protein N7496_004977 [Penicillium cataractarum]KAJ5377568.1 hypothetical protein N7496_004977 [Penicillium cataractarum]
MLLLDLPHELLLNIWDTLDTTSDMNALVRTCHYCYDNLNPLLYRYIIHHLDQCDAFEWAAEHGPVETLHKLLNTSINASNWDGLSPLDPAARHGRADILHVLIEYGFSPNTYDSCVRTPLHHAATYGYPECARILLEAGADLNSIDDKEYTPSSLAVFNGHADVLALLLDRGASIDIKLIEDDTPLRLAARMGFEELVALLLERNAAVDGVRNGMPGSPLIWAARAGHLEIVRQLLDAGADPNFFHFGQAPLHWAAHMGHEPVVALLLERGATADLSDIHGNTPLCRACYSLSMNERVVELLLKENVNVDKKNDDGKTPLSIAACRGFSKAVCYLLRQGADPNLIDNDGLSPLFIAAHYGHAQTVLDLLDGYAPPTASTNNCGTPYGEKTPGWEKYIDATDPLNRTPLFLATLYGHEEVVRVLLSRGSSAMNHATSAGRTALSVAQDQSNNPTNSDRERMNSILACLRDPSHIDVDLDNLEGLSKAAEGDNGGEVVCDSCSLAISVYDTHYHCAFCNDDDYDICLECVAVGATCYDPTHDLRHLRMVDGSWTAVTENSTEQQTFEIPIR